MDLQSRINEAEALLLADDLLAAVSIYQELTAYESTSAICYYRLAQLSNMLHDPNEAYDFYYKAFSLAPDLYKSIVSNSHPCREYVFQGKKDETWIEKCPLCQAEGRPFWCYSMPEAVGFNPTANPVRMWMYCESCHHLFARSYAKTLYPQSSDKVKLNPTAPLFSIYSAILTRIGQYAKGLSLLEIGVGKCECILVARELGFDVFGIEVIQSYVEAARKQFSLPVETHDFLEFETDRKWDVIIMGDVLEHVLDPVRAIAKAYDLLNDEGVLWISTPNFESAFAIAIGHDDPMRRTDYHLNYFSRQSLFSLLERHDLIPVDYQVSQHYNGSMEVLCVKNKA